MESLGIDKKRNNYLKMLLWNSELILRRPPHFSMLFPYTLLILAT